MALGEPGLITGAGGWRVNKDTAFIFLEGNRPKIWGVEVFDSSTDATAVATIADLRTV
jgi:hypothetical protein